LIIYIQYIYKYIYGIYIYSIYTVYLPASSRGCGILDPCLIIAPWIRESEKKSGGQNMAELMICNPWHQYQGSTASHLQGASMGRGSKEKGRMAHGLDLAY